ncbi:uncharacterized protein LOC119953344 isoform X1 [Scyliorhinus canicula]|uniref:uncharacterized protein LOC119953344 isoform X1 n=1 Tax=Scyliorhinus canicula TaxID=7830 RepID=UPI0018F3397D|nr:uncharacterized protein LOC119953344 isoform X1 [Scyliorhinus canicula]
MMASEENVKDLVFEGYLKKRKDKMKFAWSKYWFRLQNTTLFFYTEKDCAACHLRGQYYIYTVQSVREIKATNHEYPFEIVMKSGKRKLLAAERSDLRAVWMEFLWKAMQLPGPGKKNSACTWHDIPCLIERAASLRQDMAKQERSSLLFRSSDTQSQDFTSDAAHLHKSPVASRETLFKSFNSLVEPYYVSSSSVTSSSTGEEDADNETLFKDIACNQLPNKQGAKTDVAQSPWPEVAGRGTVNCQSGLYDVPKSIEKLKIDSNIQSCPAELFTSSSNAGLLGEIISDCRVSAYHWLDSTDTQNASIPS